MEITLKGEPLSTNSIYRSVCRGKFATVYMSKAGKNLKASYTKQVQDQWLDEPLEGDVRIWVELFMGTHRRHDIDNFNKILFDSLTGTVWKDDSQIQQMSIKKNYDKDDPRIIIRVEKL